MKKLTKIVSGALMIGVLVTTEITAFAATKTETDITKTSANTSISEEVCDRGSMKRGGYSFGEMEKPELTEEQKSKMTENMKENLSKQLEDGKITQEQHDQAIKDISEGKRPGFLRKGNRGFGNIERPELTDEQKAKMTENMKQRLAKQLQDGKITQEQHDQAIKDISEGKRPNRGLCNMERPELNNK